MDAKLIKGLLTLMSICVYFDSPVFKVYKNRCHIRTLGKPVLVNLCRRTIKETHNEGKSIIFYWEELCCENEGRIRRNFHAKLRFSYIIHSPTTGSRYFDEAAAAIGSCGISG